MTMLLQQNESRELLLINRPELTLEIEQQAHSSVRIIVLNLDGNDADNHISTHHLGKGCTTEIYALAVLSGNEQVSNTSFVGHDVCEGVSKQVFKYILSGSSKGYFSGKVLIAKDAQHTSAEQTNRNILLSDTARMRTLPQLEIYADDVKASHGASTGRMDDSAVFYMQQRGIPLAANKPRHLCLRRLPWK